MLAGYTHLGAENPWQPIETAPKDGRHLDLWCAEGGSTWREVDAYWTSDGWTREDGSVLRPSVARFWMPIPQEPPSAPTSGQSRSQWESSD